MKAIDDFFKNYNEERKKIKSALKSEKYQYVKEKADFIADYFSVKGREPKLTKYVWQFNRFLRDLPMEYRKNFSDYDKRENLKQTFMRDSDYLESMRGETKPLIDLQFRKDDFKVTVDSDFWFKHFQKDKNRLFLEYADENYRYFYRIFVLPDKVEISIDESYFKFRREINEHVIHAISKRIKENEETRIKHIYGSYPIVILTL